MTPFAHYVRSMLNLRYFALWKHVSQESNKMERPLTEPFQPGWGSLRPVSHPGTVKDMER